MEREFKMKSQKFLHEITDNTVTLAIDQMKCNTLAIVYFKLHAFKINGDEITINNDALYVSKRWIVTSQFNSFHETFNLTDKQINQIKELQLELCMIRISSINPLTFCGLRLSNGEYDATSHVSDKSNVLHTIEFVNNAYCNLYQTNNEDYLQIIRPYKNTITTKEILRDKCTVLAPHLVGEPAIDNPTNLFMEFMNQRDQETNIFTSGIIAPR